MRLKKLTSLLLAGALAVSSLTGCAVNKSAAVATMKDTKVKLGVANFMCMYQQALSDELYRSYYGDDVWNSDLFGMGSTMIENTKSNVMDTLHDMYTLKAHMADYEVALTDEENAAIQQAAASFISANGRSTLKELGADQGIVQEVLTLYTIRSKMHTAMIEKAEVTDEEANMRAYTMVKMDFSGTDDSEEEEVADTEEDSDEDLMETEGTEEADAEDEEEAKKEELRKTAEAIAKEAKGGTDLSAAASGNGQQAETGTYDADDEELDDEVKDALDKLKEGEVTDVIETDTAFVIAQLDKETDEEATKQNRENIKEEKYQEQLTEWQEEDGWKVKQGQLDKIRFRNKFQTTDNSNSEAETATETDTAAETDASAEAKTEADTSTAEETEGAADTEASADAAGSEGQQ